MALDRLSVFAGGWTLEAAEAVTAVGGTADWQVLDLLAALVDKSLVQAEDFHGSTRYRLLETVRQYAAERLAQRPGSELGETRAAHRDHYLTLVETAAPQLRGWDAAVWLDRLEVEFDNIRAALAFSVTDPHGAEPGLRLAAGLRAFVFSRGHSGEVIEALGALLGRPERIGRDKCDLERAVTQRRRRQLAPLDEGDRVLLDELGQSKVGHLVQRTGAVHVSVDQQPDRAVLPAAVLAHQREGRTGHRARHPQGGGEALGEDRLAGPEVPHQQDDVAGSAQSRHAPGQLPGGAGRLARPLHRPRHGRPAAISRFARTRSARISAMASPPARNT